MEHCLPIRKQNNKLQMWPHPTNSMFITAVEKNRRHATLSNKLANKGAKPGLGRLRWSKNQNCYS